jgi:hypothetical protein
MTYLLSEREVAELHNKLNKLTALLSYEERTAIFDGARVEWIRDVRAMMHSWAAILPFPNYSGGLPTEIINSDVVNDCPEHGLFYRTDQKVPVRDCDCPICEQNEFYPPTRAEREAERQMDAQERRYDERVQEGA